MFELPSVKLDFKLNFKLEELFCLLENEPCTRYTYYYSWDFRSYAPKIFVISRDYERTKILSLTGGINLVAVFWQMCGMIVSILPLV